MFDFLSSYQGNHEGLILDIGCGSGHISDQLEAAGLNVVGLDIDYSVLRDTAERHRVVLADAHQVPFRDTSFDNIACVCLLEHTEAPAKVTSEMSRVLDGAGHLVVIVPCRRGIPKALGSIYARFAHSVTPHGHGKLEIEQNFSYREVVAMLESAGFRVEKTKTAHFAPTSLLSRKYPRLTLLHLVLSRVVEALHLNFLTLNTEFHCILEKPRPIGVPVREHRLFSGTVAGGAGQ